MSMTHDTYSDNYINTNDINYNYSHNSLPTIKQHLSDEDIELQPRPRGTSIFDIPTTMYNTIQHNNSNMIPHNTVDINNNTTYAHPPDIGDGSDCGSPIYSSQAHTIGNLNSYNNDITSPSQHLPTAIRDHSTYSNASDHSCVQPPRLFSNTSPAHPVASLHRVGSLTQINSSNSPIHSMKRNSQHSSSTNNIVSMSRQITGDKSIDPDDSNVPLDELLSERQQKKQRLARKAELARVSRQQKKCRLDFLEKENVDLMNELEIIKNERNMYRQQLEQLQLQHNLNQSMQSTSIQSPTQSQHNNNQIYPNHIQYKQENNQQTDNDSMNMLTCNTPTLPTVLSSPSPSHTHSTSSNDVQLNSHTASTLHGTNNTINPLTDTQSLFNAFNEFGVISHTSTNEQYIHEQLLTILQQHKQWMSNGKQYIHDASNYIAPLLPIRFFYWLCSHSDQFYNDSDGLWHDLLSTEMQCTEPQINNIYLLRDRVKKHASVARQMDQTYMKLCDLQESHYKNASDMLEQLRSILTPIQIGKYSAWASNYAKVCIKIKTESNK